MGGGKGQEAVPVFRAVCSRRPVSRVRSGVFCLLGPRQRGPGTVSLSEGAPDPDCPLFRNAVPLPPRGVCVTASAHSESPPRSLLQGRRDKPPEVTGVAGEWCGAVDRESPVGGPAPQPPGLIPDPRAGSLGPCVWLSAAQPVWPCGRCPRVAGVPVCGDVGPWRPGTRPVHLPLWSVCSEGGASAHPYLAPSGFS